jgi:hypothetical protein
MQPLNKMICVSRDGCCSCGKSSVEGNGRVVGVATLELEELLMWGMVVGRRDVLAVRCPADASFGLSDFRAVAN